MASIFTRKTEVKVLANIPTHLYNEITTQEVLNVADQHQLEVLRQGPDAWNTWRKQHPRTQPYLNHATLSYATLFHANLTSADLSFPNFTKPNPTTPNPILPTV